MTSAAPAREGLFLSPAAVLSVPEPFETLFLLAVGVLASTIVLKFASIQYLEYLYFLLIAYLFTRLARAQFALRTDPPMARLAFHWVIWCALALGTAVYSLGRPVYNGPFDLLHRPVWVSIARLGEVVANVAGLVFLGHLFRRDRRKLLFTMRVYFYTGVASALYSILCMFTFRVLHHLLPNSSDRANGFYNEGGPYGLYIVSVILLGLFLRPLEARKGVFYASLFSCLIALSLSVSKAGYASILLLFGISALLAASLRQKLATAAVFLLVTYVVITQTNLRSGFQTYINASQSYIVYSNIRSKDGNLVVGRTAGLFLIPRMIQVHPWVGVGFAHYGLVRNTPAYRGLSVYVDVNDNTGLGILQYIAELGIPVSIYLLLLLFNPFVLLRRTTHLRRATAIGLMHPIVLMLGGQLNLTYPWVMSAFAIGLTSWTIPAEEQLEADATQPVAATQPSAPLPPALPLLPPSASEATGLTSG